MASASRPEMISSTAWQALSTACFIFAFPLPKSAPELNSGSSSSGFGLYPA
jgi:hypothetical protein